MKPVSGIRISVWLLVVGLLAGSMGSSSAHWNEWPGPLRWPRLYRIASDTSRVAVARVLGDDRRQDVLVTTSDRHPQSGSRLSDSRLFVYRQRRDGTLRSPRKYELPMGVGEAREIATGDLNGDRRLDVAVGTAAGVAVLYQRPGGGFRRFRLIQIRTPDDSHPYASAVFIGDVNSDGANDILVSGGRLLAFLRKGQTFRQVVIDREFQKVIEMADLNRDGEADIVGCSGFSGNSDCWKVSIWIHRQGLDFRKSSYGFDWKVDSYADMTVADVTGDGRRDVLLAKNLDPQDNPGHGTLGVMRQMAGGRFAALTRRRVCCGSAIEAADMDGDGDQDVVLAHDHNSYDRHNHVSILFQRSGGRLGKEKISGGPYQVGGVLRIAIGRIGRDRRADVLRPDYRGFLLYRHRPR